MKKFIVLPLLAATMLASCGGNEEKEPIWATVSLLVKPKKSS